MYVKREDCQKIVRKFAKNIKLSSDQADNLIANGKVELSEENKESIAKRMDDIFIENILPYTQEAEDFKKVSSAVELIEFTFLYFISFKKGDVLPILIEALDRGLIQ